MYLVPGMPACQGASCAAATEELEMEQPSSIEQRKREEGSKYSVKTMRPPFFRRMLQSLDIGASLIFAIFSTLFCCI